ncbi:MAG: hypothetical protein U1E36_03385 [Rickettsiales bacterium]
MRKYVLIASLTATLYFQDANAQNADKPQSQAASYAATLDDAGRHGNNEAVEEGLRALQEINTPEAYVAIGKFYERRPSGEFSRDPDYAKAFESYQKALDLSTQSTLYAQWANRARIYLSRLYLSGNGVARDQQKAVQLLKEAVAQGNAAAAFEIGRMYEFGLLTGDPDYSKAEEWYRLALKDQYGSAALAIASLYTRKLIPSPTPNAAREMAELGIKYLRTKADRGNVAAMVLIAEAYESGQGVAPDPQEALKWYLKGADAGDPSGMRAAARMLGTGNGTRVNKVKATDYMRKAANKGSLRAAVALGKALRADDNYFLILDDKEAYNWLEKAANYGDAEAIRQLANYYLEQNQKDKAINYLEASAKIGRVSSMLTLFDLYRKDPAVGVDLGKAKQYLEMARSAPNASMHEKARIVNILLKDMAPEIQDKQTGIKLMQELADAGHMPAIIFMARAYTDGIDVPQDQKKGFDLWRKAAASGDVPAMLSVSKAYAEGVGVNQNIQKAREYFDQAVANVRPEDGSSMKDIGMAFRIGRGVVPDIQKAAFWLERASNVGQVEAKKQFAELIYVGAVAKFPPKDAIPLFEQAAAQGSADALFDLGEAYASGQAVPVDYFKAAGFYRKASNLGIAAATRALGLMTLAGFGVQKDEVQGVTLLKQAVDSGSTLAMLDLANYYRFGNEKTPNWSETIRWLTRAEAAGNADASYLLGDAYMKGTGVSQSREQAVSHWRTAAARGHHFAKVSLEQMGL